MLPRLEEITAIYHEATLTEAVGTPLDEEAPQRWANILKDTLAAVWPGSDVTISVRTGAGETDIKAFVPHHGLDPEESHRVAAVAQELLGAWVMPRDETCLTADKDGGLCEVASQVVVAGAPMGAGWRPTDERPEPKGWPVSNGQWWTSPETAFDVYVPKPVVSFEVREPGATAWVVGLPTVEKAREELSRAAQQGVKASIHVVALGRHFAIQG